MTRRFEICSLVVVFLMSATVAGAEVPASSARESGGHVPQHDLLDLFGNDADASAPNGGRSARTGGDRPVEIHLQPVPGTAESAEPAPPESEQTIRRPESSPSSGLGQTLADKQNQNEANREISYRKGGSVTPLKDWWPLLVVLGLIIVLALVVRRFRPGRNLLTGAGAMDVVARLPLSAKQSVVLVKLGRQLVLLGVTPEQVNTLCVIDDPEQVAMLLGEAASGREGSISQTFSRAMNEEASAYLAETERRDETHVISGEVRTLLDKVRRLKRGREVA